VDRFQTLLSNFKLRRYTKAMYFKALSQSDAVFQLHVPSGPTEGAVQAGPAAPRPTSNYAFPPAAAHHSTAVGRCRLTL
jgi:hypothetical protein